MIASSLVNIGEQFVLLISIIAAMARNQVIGQGNQIPWYLPADLKHFKKMTFSKPVVMGRKTFDSIGQPLPGRRNYVLTRNRQWNAKGVGVIYKLEDILSHEKNISELVIIGGGQVYAHYLPMAQYLYLTRIDINVAGDTYFPSYSDSDWERISCKLLPTDRKNPYPCQFETWQRRRLPLEKTD